MLLAAPAYGQTEQFRLSGVSKINGQYLVNLVDSQGNQNIWLKEGLRSHGYELLEVDPQGGFARIRKNGQTFIVNLKSSAVEVQKTHDDFGKIGKAYIKDLFDGGDRDGNLVTGKLSRDDTGKGRRTAFFKTNGGNYGKLLFKWEEGRNVRGEKYPVLMLHEMVTFDARSGISICTLENIALGSAQHIDLDSGMGSHLGRIPDDYSPDIHFSNVDGKTMYIRGTDGASFLFPVPNGS